MAPPMETDPRGPRQITYGMVATAAAAAAPAAFRLREYGRVEVERTASFLRRRSGQTGGGRERRRNFFFFFFFF